MTIDFNQPTINGAYATNYQYIVDNLKAALRMNFTGAVNIPNGTIRWNATDKKFEIYDSATTAWSNLGEGFTPGTVMLFGQNSAPTGWTRKADWQDNSMLCYAATGDIGSGGEVNPQTAHTHDAGTIKVRVARMDGGNFKVYNSTGGEVTLGYHTAIDEAIASGLGILRWQYNTNTPFYSDPSVKVGTSGDNPTPYYQEVIAATKD